MTDKFKDEQTRFYKATAFILFETQRMERFLKTLLVFLRYDGSLGVIESLEKSKTELDDKSLGSLLQFFKKNSELNPQGARTFKNFLDNRNKFAHQLIELPGFNDSTIEGIEVGLSFIKEYRKSMLLVESFLVPMSIMIMIGRLIAFYSDAPDDPLKQLIMYLRERLDIVNKLLAEEFDMPVIHQHEISPKEDPQTFYEYFKMLAIVDAVNTKSLDKLNLDEKVIELWKQEEIIVALNEVGVSCIDEQEWAPLATCGRLLKQKYPNIKLADYGVEKLSILLEVSNVFEIKKDHTGFYFRPFWKVKNLN